jgi:hypothetical protein
VCRSNRTAASHDGRSTWGSHGSRPACCPSARHFEGARPTPSCLAGPVASRRGWVRCGRPLWRYTGGRSGRIKSFCHSFCSWLQCRSWLRCGASGGASMLTATAWSSGTCFGPSRFPGASLPPSSSKGWTQWPSATCTTIWSSSGMTDLGSGPRHPAVEQDPATTSLNYPAVEQDPASTSLNSGNVCSPCDTPQLGHSSTQRRDSRPPPFSCRAMPQLRWTPSRGPFATRFLGSGNPPLCQVMSAASSSRPTGPATTWSRFARSLIRLHRGWLLRGSRAPLPADGG